MKLCISNIAWDKAYDEEVYKVCSAMGYDGIEIAPTRVFPNNPYDHLDDAKNWAKNLEIGYGLKVYSCQSIWYGRTENIFESEDDRERLLEYSKKAFCFAEAVGAKNAVFGCPKNRNGYGKKPDRNDMVAEDFFSKLAVCAADYGITLSIEANPDIYGTDFLTRTKDTIEFIKRLGYGSLKLNLDIGTMLYDNENLGAISEFEELIGHIHISEPKLAIIRERMEHVKLFQYLRSIKYEKAVSVEMGKADGVEQVYETMRYIYSISKAYE